MSRLALLNRILTPNSLAEGFDHNERVCEVSNRAVLIAAMCRTVLLGCANSTSCERGLP